MPDGAVVETDLCVAGAGAAGISIALEFLRSGHSVALLEAGGFDRDPSSQALYKGHIEPPLANLYLEASRLRYFGGTTNHWLGTCRPLDEIDFEARDWVPHSGWPISRATLDPYYRRALSVGRIETELDPSAPLVADETSRIRTVSFHVKPLRFGIEYRAVLVESPDIDLHLHANVVEVALAGNGRSVDHLEVASSAGKRFEVRAKHFVLALGGIENARLLLVSDNIHRRGVGNDHDQVGRYFMDHPVFPVASVCTHRADGPLTDSHRGENPALFQCYRVSDAEQAASAMSNCWFGFDLVPQVEDTREQLLSGRAWKAIERFLEPEENAGPVPRIADWAEGSSELFFRRIDIRPEQIPNPESRITLADTVDRFGKRRAHLAWRLTEDDFRTARRAVELLGEELGRFGLGRARLEPGIRLEDSYSPGFHHMGSTRMQADPKRGVVDRDCRVHGVENLHVAGSSVFCTSGYANPTLTLIALALRLADRLKTKLGGPV